MPHSTIRPIQRIFIISGMSLSIDCLQHDTQQSLTDFAISLLLEKGFQVKIISRSLLLTVFSPASHSSVVTISDAYTQICKTHLF